VLKNTKVAQKRPVVLKEGLFEVTRSATRHRVARGRDEEVKRGKYIQMKSASL
jgi:hypothetical protein